MPISSSDTLVVSQDWENLKPLFPYELSFDYVRVYRLSLPSSSLHVPQQAD